MKRGIKAGKAGDGRLAARTECEIAVVGGGAAGLTAGLFAARCGRSTAVLVAEMPGGLVANIERIEDFPGHPDGIAGFELGPAMQQQAAAAGAQFRAAQALRLEKDGGGWRLTCSDGEARARAVILAMGSRPNKLGLTGEDRFEGRGISHCASCDGPLLRGGPAIVVGGGDSAFQEALLLAEMGSAVTIIHRSAEPRAMRTYRRRVAEHPAIETRGSAVVEELVGADVLEAVRVRDSEGRVVILEAAGLFVYAGVTPNTELMANLVALDDTGRIPTDVRLRTSLEGMFAAGDVRSGSCGQAVSAAGDGAAAALAAHGYLEGVGFDREEFSVSPW